MTMAGEEGGHHRAGYMDYAPCSVQGQDAPLFTRHRASKVGLLKMHSPELP